MNLRFNNESHSDEKIYESVKGILEKNKLLSMASITTDNKSWINTAYFAFDEDFNLYILTHNTTIHHENILNNESVAVSIFDSNQSGEKLQGLQIQGKCISTETAELENAHRVYNSRYDWLAKSYPDPETLKNDHRTLYKITPDKIKILDEENFGKREYITVDIQR